MRVFKFGGASVKDAKSVKNVAEILAQYKTDKLVVVVSAMGKTTNALEEVMVSYHNGNIENTIQLINNLADFHQKIITELFESETSKIQREITTIFSDLKNKCALSFDGSYDFQYDQIISLGEVLSTLIIDAYLNQCKFKSQWIDSRTLIRTNDRWREGRVDWEITENLIQKKIGFHFNGETQIVVTQGFLAHEENGLTTTLGREGSDFTAAIYAYCLNAKDVTIWKDVPGMLNADPKYFDDTVLLEKISFKEAIELAYFGASVIHPKTIQPLKRKKIPLHIKSFVNPKEQGSVIQESSDFDDHIPSFIFKMDQVLISLTPRDFSFIVEENLEHIFRYLNIEKTRVNLMQNSAVSFSFIVDRKKVDIEKLVTYFKADYLVKYNAELELITVRHYDSETIERLTVDKKIILEQKTRQTARLAVSPI